MTIYQYFNLEVGNTLIKNEFSKIYINYLKIKFFQNSILLNEFV